MAKMKDKVLAAVSDEVKTQVQEAVQDARTTIAETAGEVEQRMRDGLAKVEASAAEAGAKVRESDAFKEYRAAGPDKRRLWIAIAVVGFCVLMAVLFGTRASANDCKPAFPTDIRVGCYKGHFAIRSESANEALVSAIKCPVDA